MFCKENVIVFPTKGEIDNNLSISAVATSQMIIVMSQSSTISASLDATISSSNARKVLKGSDGVLCILSTHIYKLFSVWLCLSFLRHYRDTILMTICFWACVSILLRAFTQLCSSLDMRSCSDFSFHPPPSPPQT